MPLTCEDFYPRPTSSELVALNRRVVVVVVVVASSLRAAQETHGRELDAFGMHSVIVLREVLVLRPEEVSPQ
jgi:hypothetical protein